MLELINPVRSPLFAPKLGRSQYVHIGRESVHNIGINPIFLILLAAEKCLKYDTTNYSTLFVNNSRVCAPSINGSVYKRIKDLNHSKAFSLFFKA